MQEPQKMQVWSLGREDPLEEGMETHSSILAWRIHVQSCLVGYSQQGHRELDTSKQTTGEGNGNPLSTLAWKIQWAEEPGRLQSMGSLRVRHNWATSLSLFTFMHWRRTWQPTPVFLPGESQDRGAWWAAVPGVTKSQTWLRWLNTWQARIWVQMEEVLRFGSLNKILNCSFYIFESDFVSGNQIFSQGFD